MAQILENTYEMVCESKIMHGFEVSGLSEAWKEIGKFHCRFLKELMVVPYCAVSGFVEMGLGREGSRQKSP